MPIHAVLMLTVLSTSARVEPGKKRNCVHFLVIRHVVVLKRAGVSLPPKAHPA